MTSEDALLTLSETVTFEFATALPAGAALAFVRDPRASLASAPFIADLRVRPAQGPVGTNGVALVSADLLVDTPLFGRRRFPFVSELHETATGARLLPVRPVETLGSSAEGPGSGPPAEPVGWAEVTGSVEVAAVEATGVEVAGVEVTAAEVAAIEVAGAGVPVAATGADREAGVVGSAASASSAGSADNVARASVLRYEFGAKVYLDLPAGERWGGRALAKMVRFAAATVLRELLRSLRTTLSEAAARAAVPAAVAGE